jgi:predicted enzyme related to lactoylglutathione lyase
VFGWTVSHDDTLSTDTAYQIFTTGDAEGLHGGLFPAKEELPNYAVFAVLVEDFEDVVAACGGPKTRVARSSARRRSTRSG